MSNRVKQEWNIISVEITDFCCHDFVAKIPSNCMNKEFCSNLISRIKSCICFVEIMEYYSHDFFFLQKFREITLRRQFDEIKLHMLFIISSSNWWLHNLRILSHFHESFDISKYRKTELHTTLQKYFCMKESEFDESLFFMRNDFSFFFYFSYIFLDNQYIWSFLMEKENPFCKSLLLLQC